MINLKVYSPLLYIAENTLIAENTVLGGILKENNSINHCGEYNLEIYKLLHVSENINVSENIVLGRNLESEETIYD